jgi:hypothetical protein
MRGAFLHSYCSLFRTTTTAYRQQPVNRISATTTKTMTINTRYIPSSQLQRIQHICILINII